MLVISIGLLAASTGFFYAKTRSLQKSTNNSTKENQDANKNVTETAANTSQEVALSVTQPAPIGNRPSSPSDTVVVEAGETLFVIGQKVGLSWTVIAEANGIEGDKIQAGKTLFIPKNGQISYTVNQDKANFLQKEADSGKNAFRLSPVETAKSDCSPAYGLSTSDPFTQTKIDQAAGTAVVNVTHGGKSYTISLTQPVTKGAKGIWAIQSIKPS